MKTDVTKRIAERTRIADLRMGEMGWFGRITNRLGLFIANAVDELTAFADNERTVFMGATAAGLMRGAVYGVIATIFIAALFPLHALAVPLLLTLVAAGAIGYGMYDGQKGLEHHLNRSDHKFSDTIAEKSGAVPAKTTQVTQSSEETLRISGRDPALVKQAPADPANAASFAERENTRRSEVLPQQR